ncbi:carbohydrate ABC transporter permease [Caldibacillus lycopersici]|uniref:Carbohydrate ABC transporter permease n=1 Tax=Perspicuibacillus lycopersici TaxID=1325689 RepID=A0AAE3IT52_9BACI|nr:carbohydrate ABC transporter permease [Perspicuibacillus lycopersici]MCU9613173.1 carbohydrate ABC transporter permease [Perspicuibacillus lycopersici]
MNYKTTKILWKTFVWIVLIIGTIITLVPLFWMLSTALKSNAEVMQFDMVWWPEDPKWSNFVEAFTTLPFGEWTMNTIFITVFTIIGTLLSCTVVAYGFARFNVRGNKTLFIILLSTMMLPSTVTMIPQFVIFRELDWINTFYPLIVPSFFGNATFIFLLRQFFMTIPTELEDAAKMDGLGTMGILGRIILPMTLPALTTVAIFQFNGAWNDFMGPLIYLSDPDDFTLALGINFFKGENNQVQWNYLMSASVISMLPSLLIFFFGQKYFIQGINLSSGIKG